MFLAKVSAQLSLTDIFPSLNSSAALNRVELYWNIFPNAIWCSFSLSFSLSLRKLIESLNGIVQELSQVLILVSFYAPCPGNFIYTLGFHNSKWELIPTLESWRDPICPSQSLCGFSISAARAPEGRETYMILYKVKSALFPFKLAELVVLFIKVMQPIMLGTGWAPLWTRLVSWKYQICVHETIHPKASCEGIHRRGRHEQYYGKYNRNLTEWGTGGFPLHRNIY